ncbi:hypothetical protein FN846DRAFT_683455 [Sphaerosporella brunnea]|uniref:Extracellular membrane protein CFEM domain-containing protein n=1 Tax=Sphaerosporella brunnea TaxID=1250544 RepID=A0A5J5EZU9_9PEZI|nr:hypothetical protein FN846DRAFT_683455 [Sphaerosporella brunnea]
MMFFKVNVLATLLVAGLVNAATTTTPAACVLACANTQPNPSDMSAICPAESMQTCLQNRCDSAVYDAAEAHFVQVCKDAGYSVAKISASASGSKTKSASASVTATGASSSASGAVEHSNAGRVAAPVYVMLAAMAAFVLV